MNGKDQLLWDAICSAFLADDDDALQTRLHDRPDLAGAVDEDGRTLLHYAALECATRCIGKLIECGADVEARDKWQMTPLLVAVGEEPLALDHLGAVRVLIEAGANPNVSDCGGVTPLQSACGACEDEIAYLLLTRGAEPTAHNAAGNTALHVACTTWMATRLLQAGASAAVRNTAGETPAEFATKRGFHNVAKFLGKGD